MTNSCVELTVTEDFGLKMFLTLGIFICYGIYWHFLIFVYIFYISNNFLIYWMGCLNRLTSFSSIISVTEAIQGLAPFSGIRYERRPLRIDFLQKATSTRRLDSAKLIEQRQTNQSSCLWESLTLNVQCIHCIQCIGTVQWYFWTNWKTKMAIQEWSIFKQSVSTKIWLQLLGWCFADWALSRAQH